jgi:probable F420-dependent oxidoreductase
VATHPFRFGVITETFHDRRQLQTLAHTAEDLGFSTILIRDHLAPDYFGPQFAPLTALAFLAGVTTRLRLGTMVIANDFRHPTMLAKEAATLDVLSNGRFELGIGAGWLRTEYDRAGLSFDQNGLRIDRLEESLQILRACFTTQDIAFAGTHYTLDGHQHFPAPLHPNGPPILIGAGLPRMLRLAGTYADIVGLLTVSVSSGEIRDDISARKTTAVKDRIEHIRAGAGNRFDQIELSLIPEIVITDDRAAGFDDVSCQNDWGGIDHAEIKDMPGIFVGSVEQISDQMIARRKELGISYYVVPDSLMMECAPIFERLSGS